MRKNENSGKYILENKLRTWSELKSEREAERKEKEKSMPAEKLVEGTQSSTRRGSSGVAVPMDVIIGSITP